ncbi:mandelate racemase/muconate lactonizing enzyme family protein [Limnochorda pilosa]|uniref:Mandelate racemase n=1 Tax=Limnochorda pilosa TaxID=1555112 RepID=A0A0K2SL32_LIMPI|nr:mandelate racemase/muconate lactonizing enzyme family protein [Limnochorda pilosa]BAS27823.1 mandelate racemase [Limnochorda pilosa]
MRIRKVETRLLEAPLAEPMGGSARRPPIRSRRLLVVRLETDEGVTGYGESYGTPRSVKAMVEELYAPFLLGADPLSGDPLARMQREGVGYHGPKGMVYEALSAVDTALWDLKGKALNAALASLLGGAITDTVDCYAASVYLGSVEEAESQAARFAETGFRAMKVKVGQGLERDRAVFRAVRRLVGEGTTLMADVNGVYDVKTSIRLGRSLEEDGLYWLEEPVPVEDVEGYAQVARALSCYVAGSEGEYTRHGFRELIERGGVDVVQPDVTRCGGVTETWAAATLASAYHRRFSPHCWSSVFGLAASTHLTAAAPTGLTVEYDAHPNPLKDALVGAQLTPVGGRLPVPAGPGLGVQVDEEAFERLTVWASEVS